MNEPTVKMIATLKQPVTIEVEEWSILNEAIGIINNEYELSVDYFLSNDGNEILQDQTWENKPPTKVRDATEEDRKAFEVMKYLRVLKKKKRNEKKTSCT